MIGFIVSITTHYQKYNTCTKSLADIF